MESSSKKAPSDAIFDPRFSDWLEEIRELNRLFLTYVQALAREGRSCPGLGRRIARRLRDAEPGALERIAALPTALFALNVEQATGTRELSAPEHALDRARLALHLTVLSSAWHMARSRPFEARMFLRLSAVGVERLRALPVSELPTLANAPEMLSCALADGGLTWPALIRDQGPEEARMLVLIALQPHAHLLPSILGPASRAALRSYS